MVERIHLTKWQFATLFLAQQGKCAKCGAKLERGQTIDEHLHPLGLEGGNELENRQLWCRPCSKVKTFGKPHLKKDGDISKIAAADRIARGGKNKGPGPKSRGFDKRLRKKMDGTVERREQ